METQVKTEKEIKIDRVRHILKAITWRIVGTLDTILLGWLISGDPTVGLSIGGLELVTKMVLYYLHERAWYHVNFGIRHKRRLVKGRRNARKLRDIIIFKKRK
jgi:uncharacterized membrane protein